MDYSGINAKVKAMKGRLLKKEDYLELSNSKNVEAVGIKLREYPYYKKFIDDVLSKPDHSRHIFEPKIMEAPANNYIKIYSFISDFSIKKYLKALLLRREMLLIKLIFCSLYDERDITFSADDLESLSKFDLNFDINKLLLSKTPRELVDNLKDTEFYQILDNIYTDNMSIFDLEMSLDFYFYDNLWKSKNKYLDGINKKIMTDINGTEIDMQNIIWIWRLKKYYDIKPNDIYKYLIPIHYRLSAEEVTRFAEAPNISVLYEQIDNTAYREIFKEKGDLSLVFQKTMDKVYTKYLSHENSIAHIVWYLNRAHTETENIVSLMEGVRYELKQEEIMKFIYIVK